MLEGTLARLAEAVVPLIAFCACSCSSSSNSGNGNAKVTSIDGAKVIQTLTSDEVQQLLCTDLPNYQAAQLPESVTRHYTCGYSIPLQGLPTAACETSYQSCLAETTTITPGDCTVNMDALVACGATVAQFSTCIRDTVAGLRAFYDAWDKLGSSVCSNADAGAGIVRPSAAPSCTAFVEACAALASSIPAAPAA